MITKSNIKYFNVTDQHIHMTIPCTFCKTDQIFTVREEDAMEWAYRNKHTQDAFPYLTPPEREMFISGTCGTCYSGMFGTPLPVDLELKKDKNGRVLITPDKIMDQFIYEEKNDHLSIKLAELSLYGYNIVDEVTEEGYKKILLGKNGWYIVLMEKLNQ